MKSSFALCSGHSVSIRSALCACASSPRSTKSLTMYFRFTVWSEKWVRAHCWNSVSSSTFSSHQTSSVMQSNKIDLRVQMMEKSRYPFLMECIYSLLMIIPQGRIFESLKNRVDVLNHVDVMEPRPQKHYRRDLEVYLGEFQRALRLQPS